MTRARSRAGERNVEAVKRRFSLSQTEAGEEPIVFVELDTRRDDACTVLLERDRCDPFGYAP